MSSRYQAVEVAVDKDHPYLRDSSLWRVLDTSTYPHRLGFGAYTSEARCLEIVERKNANCYVATDKEG